MKKIIFSILALSLISVAFCQQEQTTKQYFKESPEIEIAKKAVAAYLKGDLEAYRSCYADTARLWHNQYYLENPGKTIDEQIKFIEAALPTLSYYNYEGELFWEMIILDNGDKWVYFWGTWVAKYIGDDEEIGIGVHIAFAVTDDKIVGEYGFWDTLPIYLAQQRLKSKSK